MKFSIKNEQGWLHYYVDQEQLNGKNFKIRKLQNKFYVQFEEEWHPIYLPADPKALMIINNQPHQFFQGFIPSGLDNQNKGSLKTSMPGKIVKILVEPNQNIKANQTLIILEAMKMENEIKASMDGIIKEIYVKENQLVDSNVLLMDIL